MNRYVMLLASLLLWTPDVLATPLHLKVSVGDAAAVRTLLKKGADPNITDEFGRSPLYLAATMPYSFGDYAAVIAALLQAGADPNAPNRLRQTPLHETAASGHAAVVAALLQADADPSATDVSGRTPLYNAAASGHAAVVAALLQAGADCAKRTAFLETAFSIAQKKLNEFADLEKNAREAGLDVRRNGRTPAEDKSRYNAVVQLLIKHGTC